MTLLQAGTLLSVMTTVQIFLNITSSSADGKVSSTQCFGLTMLVSGLLATILFWTGIHPLMWVGAVVNGYST